MKKLFLLTALSVFLFVFPSCDSGNGSDSSDDPSFNQETAAAFKTAVDSALNDAAYQRGISVAVHKEGYRMWTYAAGYADGDYDSTEGAPMRTSTPTFAYSITKTAVSALVLTQIIDENLYELGDTVDELLGDNADYIGLSAGQKALIKTDATVSQLLRHMTGMLDYASNLADLIPMCDPAAEWEPADILEEIVFADLADPDTFNYSNTNYILLGMIAEEAADRPLNELLESKFFDRLGINAVLAPQDDYPSNIAHPYDDAYIFGISGVPVGTFMDFSTGIKLLDADYDYYTGVGRCTWAAGGIIATAAGLAGWGHELYDEEGNAVSEEVRTLMEGSATADGSYGYGITYDDFTYDDFTVGGLYGHDGGAPGYKTSLRYEKTKGITVAIITNVNNTHDGSGLVDQDALAENILNAYSE